MKIIVVEDEIRIREGLVKLIRRFFPQVSQVCEAKSGEEGIHFIHEMDPDIVITDIRMEPLNGLEMLRILNQEKKWNFKSVILSAYSEFEYAKQAISLGVNEYLIKPVEIEELRKVMDRLEEELREEKQMRTDTPKQLRSLETILSNVLSGQLEMNEELGGFLLKNYEIHWDEPAGMIRVYMGRRFEEEKAFLITALQNSLLKKGYQNSRVISFPTDQEVVVLLFSIADEQQLERYLQYTFLSDIHRVDTAATVGFTVCQDFRELRAQLETLRDVMPWNISLGEDVLISFPKILDIHSAELIYPAEMEKKCTDALYKMNYEILNEQMERFLQYFIDQPYPPDTIKKSILRCIWNLLNAAKEVNFEAYKKVDEQSIIEAVTHAATFGELEMVVYSLQELLIQRKAKAVGLIVKKAQSLVEEFYQQGITLEEIASKLGVSPEHISAQFTRELGINFSKYYRDYRLVKAKELLAGTDLKIYQVAAKAGYRDAKYFSKVFRESEGILPMEYRQNHR